MMWYRLDPDSPCNAGDIIWRKDSFPTGFGNDVCNPNDPVFSYNLDPNQWLKVDYDTPLYGMTAQLFYSKCQAPEGKPYQSFWRKTDSVRKLPGNKYYSQPLALP